MVRRSIGWVLTLILAMIVMNAYDWHRKSFDQLADHPVRSFLLLALVVAFVVVLVWAAVRHSAWKTFLAAGLGALAVAFGWPVLHSIGWGGTLLLIAAIVIAVALWALTVLDRVPDRVKSSRAVEAVARAPRPKVTWQRGSRTATSYGSRPPGPRPSTPSGYSQPGSHV